MNWKEIREAALKAAREIAAAAQAEGRALTPDEIKSFDSEMAKAADAKSQMDAIAESEKRFAALAAIPEEKKGKPVKADDADDEPKSLGDFYIKSVGGSLAKLKELGQTLSAPEYSVKANTDVHTVTSVFDLVLRDVDRTVVRAYRRPLVSDVLGTGSISGTQVVYFVEGAIEGTITTVAEGAQKPQIHIVPPTTVTDSLKKIAAWWDLSDEMIEDIPFMVSEINNRGVRLLAEREEQQLLTGDGTGTNILGILNRSGIQTMTQADASHVGETVPDSIFRAATGIQTATGLFADALLINPADYMKVRLLKDANGQYFGGGFFGGPYAAGDGVTWQPPIWGLNTVVTAAMTAGTVAVGALKDATTVYRKGGVRVETTNSDQGKFTKDVVTTRIEERLALAVRNPLAIVKLTLA